MNNCPKWAKECCNHSFRMYYSGEENDPDVESVLDSLPKQDKLIMETVFNNNLKLKEGIEKASQELNIREASIFRLVQKTSLKLLIVRGCVCE